MSELPLSRVRVLDLSRVLAAPWAAQMLADFGAEVIKLERAGLGDDSRRFGPPFLKDSRGRETDQSPMFLAVNRNKKSVTVDLSKPEGQALVRRLAAVSDVVIENYKVGDLARYGLDYASLSGVNPRLIYCSVTGFGQTGPYRKRLGYDPIFQGMSGLMSVTGYPDEAPGGAPVTTGVSIADILCGHYATSAILAALHHRDTVSGRGQYIDLALLDAMVASLSHCAQTYFITGQAPGRRGTEGNGGQPSRMFRCADGAVMIVAGNDDQFERLCHALELPELARDPRFMPGSARSANRRQLAPILEQALARRSVHEVLSALDAAKVPAGPINDLQQVFEDPQVRERGLRVEVPHARAGSVPLLANPIRMSATPLTRYEAPPAVGEHTRQVLRELLQIDDAELERLAAAKVL